jgi:hypothetical protein
MVSAVLNCYYVTEFDNEMYIGLCFYEILDDIPSSVIVVMVHVVNGRQRSAYTVPHAGASIAEMESETDSRPR